MKITFNSVLSPFWLSFTSFYFSFQNYVSHCFFFQLWLCFLFNSVFSLCFPSPLVILWT
jgi:hypothetical protein